MKEKFYITTAIAYSSRKPHIGNTFEVIMTDAIARYKRKQGYDVFFLTGTDEHGQKIENCAKEAGISPKQYIIQLKMNHACDLLRTGQYTVSQASEQCGFRDVYFFSRQFKKYIGCPPSVFAKNSSEH